jgi:hypothetical protein
MRMNEAWIKRCLIAIGVVTSTTLFAAFAPTTVLQGSFGATITDPLGEVVVRSWGLLIGLIGGMLVHAAFHPAERKLVMSVTLVSKIGFLVIIVGYGRAFFPQVAPTFAFDLLAVGVLAACLFAGRQSR